MTEDKLKPCLDKDEAQDIRKTLLFVCTGNTCRSPMAAALYNHLYSDSAYYAESAGLAAYGQPISENAAAALMERGVLPTLENNYLTHISRPLTDKLIENADLVIGLTGSHALNIMMRFPAYASKITAMPRDISDPYGGDLEDYRKCLADIEAALIAVFGEVRKDSESDE